MEIISQNSNIFFTAIKDYTFKAKIKLKQYSGLMQEIPLANRKSSKDLPTQDGVFTDENPVAKFLKAFKQNLLSVVEKIGSLIQSVSTESLVSNGIEKE